MKAFVDTSVLVGAFYGDQPTHEASVCLFAASDKTRLCCAAHTMAELYSTLTGIPGKDRIAPGAAVQHLQELRNRMTVVALSQTEYYHAIEAAAAVGVAGAGIYDVLIAHCSLKIDAAVIYTWNIKH